MKYSQIIALLLLALLATDLVAAHSRPHHSRRHRRAATVAEGENAAEEEEKPAVSTGGEGGEEETAAAPEASGADDLVDGCGAAHGVNEAFEKVNWHAYSFLDTVEGEEQDCKIDTETFKFQVSSLLGIKMSEITDELLAKLNDSDEHDDDGKGEGESDAEDAASISAEEIANGMFDLVYELFDDDKTEGGDDKTEGGEEEEEKDGEEEPQTNFRRRHFRRSATAAAEGEEKSDADTEEGSDAAAPVDENDKPFNDLEDRLAEIEEATTTDADDVPFIVKHGLLLRGVKAPSVIEAVKAKLDGGKINEALVAYFKENNIAEVKNADDDAISKMKTKFAECGDLSEEQKKNWNDYAHFFEDADDDDDDCKIATPAFINLASAMLGIKESIVGDEALLKDLNAGGAEGEDAAADAAEVSAAEVADNFYAYIKGAFTKGGADDVEDRLAEDFLIAKEDGAEKKVSITFDLSFWMRGAQNDDDVKAVMEKESIDKVAFVNFFAGDAAEAKSATGAPEEGQTEEEEKEEQNFRARRHHARRHHRAHRGPHHKRSVRRHRRN